MFRKITFILAILALATAPLQAGTIHEVFSQTYTGSTALSTTDLLTPPTVDRSYLVTIYYTMTARLLPASKIPQAPISHGRTTRERNS